MARRGNAPRSRAHPMGKPNLSDMDNTGSPALWKIHEHPGCGFALAYVIALHAFKLWYALEEEHNFSLLDCPDPGPYRKHMCIISRLMSVFRQTAPGP
eukprot:6782346-Karenia_brevis.AAC.1